MDFNIRAVGERLDKTVWGINTGLCQSEYLWNLVERAGRKTDFSEMGNVLAPPLLRLVFRWKERDRVSPTIIRLLGIISLSLENGHPVLLADSAIRKHLNPSALQKVRHIDPVTIEPD